MLDVDAYAQSILRDVRLDGADAPSPVSVAKRLGGISLLRSPRHALVGGFGQSARVGDRWVIRVRHGLTARFERFIIAHELGHVVLARDGVRLEPEHVEPWCNGFAAALVLPRAPLRSAWLRFGELERVIESFPHLGPTCVALRLGETRLADVYVFDRKRLAYARAERPIPRDTIARSVRLGDGRERSAIALDPCA